MGGAREGNRKDAKGGWKGDGYGRGMGGEWDTMFLWMDKKTRVMCNSLVMKKSEPERKIGLAAKKVFFCIKRKRSPHVFAVGTDRTFREVSFFFSSERHQMNRFPILGAWRAHTHGQFNMGFKRQKHSQR